MITLSISTSYVTQFLLAETKILQMSNISQKKLLSVSLILHFVSFTTSRIYPRYSAVWSTTFLFLFFRFRHRGGVSISSVSFYLDYDHVIPSKLTKKSTVVSYEISILLSIFEQIILYTGYKSKIHVCYILSSDIPKSCNSCFGNKLYNC